MGVEGAAQDKLLFWEDTVLTRKNALECRRTELLDHEAACKESRKMRSRCIENVAQTLRNAVVHAFVGALALLTFWFVLEWWLGQADTWQLLRYNLVVPSVCFCACLLELRLLLRVRAVCCEYFAAIVKDINSSELETKKTANLSDLVASARKSLEVAQQEVSSATHHADSIRREQTSLQDNGVSFFSMATIGRHYLGKVLGAQKLMRP